jgi:hypothetical protein
LDFVEFQIETKNRLLELRQKILSGTYEPVSPSRFESAKGSGAYRIITIPDVEDIIVYRLISDEVYRLAQKYESPNAFYSRRHGRTPIGQKIDRLESDEYERFFPVWKRYNQYRSKTLLHDLYNVLVITDISNYFDSIQHPLLFEYLMPLGLSRETIGLLGRLLQALRPPSGFSPTPPVGLPVDEFDCSRQIAHVFLFEHDQRIIAQVGKENYVRWMDDQNVGARGYTDARRVVRAMTASLAEQRLTLNTGKTKFLNPDEAAVHFHLDTNDLLDKIQKSINDRSEAKYKLVKKLSYAWNHACKYEGKGNWDKVLKRFYGLASILGSSLLWQRVYDDLVNYPTLAPRIFEYMIARKTYAKLVQTFEEYIRNGECLYESVALSFFEAFLISDPPAKVRVKLRKLAQRALGKDWPPELGAHPKYAAAICLFWVGDKRSARSLLKQVREHGRELPEGVTRALISGAACLAPDKIQDVLIAAVQAGKPSVASLATTIVRLRSKQIQDIEGSRILFPRYSWALQRNIYDARMWLRLEILAFSTSPKIRVKLQKEIERLIGESLTASETRCLNRLRNRVKISHKKK